MIRHSAGVLDPPCANSTRISLSGLELREFEFTSLAALGTPGKAIEGQKEDLVVYHARLRGVGRPVQSFRRRAQSSNSGGFNDVYNIHPVCDDLFYSVWAGYTRTVSPLFPSPCLVLTRLYPVHSIFGEAVGQQKAV